MFQHATDLIREIDTHSHQLRASGEQGADHLAVKALDHDLTIPAGPHDLRQAASGASTCVGAFLSAARHMAHMVWVWRSRAETRRAMSMLSDHVLRDIGLTRADVDREVMKPFWRG
jgi:uncharacterized protein YjiS (DUF1127 family)